VEACRGGDGGKRARWIDVYASLGASLCPETETTETDPPTQVCFRRRVSSSPSSPQSLYPDRHPPTTIGRRLVSPLFISNIPSQHPDKTPAHTSHCTFSPPQKIISGVLSDKVQPQILAVPVHRRQCLYTALFALRDALHTYSCYCFQIQN